MDHGRMMWFLMEYIKRYNSSPYKPVSGFRSSSNNVVKTEFWLLSIKISRSGI